MNTSKSKRRKAKREPLKLRNTRLYNGECPIYRDQYGNLWEDRNIGEGDPDIYSLTAGAMSPISVEYVFAPEP